MKKFRDFFRLLFIRRVRRNPDYYDITADVSALFLSVLKTGSEKGCKSRLWIVLPGDGQGPPWGPVSDTYRKRAMEYAKHTDGILYEIPSLVHTNAKNEG